MPRLVSLLHLGPHDNLHIGSAVNYWCVPAFVWPVKSQQILHDLRPLQQHLMEVQVFWAENEARTMTFEISGSIFLIPDDLNLQPHTIYSAKPWIRNCHNPNHVPCRYQTIMSNLYQCVHQITARNSYLSIPHIIPYSRTSQWSGQPSFTFRRSWVQISTRSVSFTGIQSQHTNANTTTTHAFVLHVIVGTVYNKLKNCWG